MDSPLKLQNPFNSNPLVAFYFSVRILEFGPLSETSFKEVSGIEMSIGTEEIAEGGVNNTKHKVPVAPSHGNITLKRGITTSISSLYMWCYKTLNANLEIPIVPMTLMISLKNEHGLPVKFWTALNAYPVKWSLSDLDSTKNEIAIESMEFAFSKIL